MPQDLIKIKQSTQDNAVTCCDGNDYPWGTQLTLRDEMIEEIGIEALSPGDIVEVRGFAFVESKSEHSDENSSSKSMSLQMTFIKVTREEDDAAKQLYGK